MRHQIRLSEAEGQTEFQRVSKDLLTHNAKQGVNYWAGSPYPTMLIWAGRVYDFLHVLEGIVGHLPARRHSYLVGYRSGWDGVGVNLRLLRGGSKSDRAVRILLTGARILAGAGWGRSAVRYDDDPIAIAWEFPKGTAIGLAARAEGKRANPACAFIAGFIAGWTDRSLGIEAEFREVKCVARGERVCRFESTEFIRFRK